jgi:hypothetical protein
MGMRPTVPFRLPVWLRGRQLRQELGGKLTGSLMIYGERVAKPECTVGLPVFVWV